jgi:hypothetical protein
MVTEIIPELRKALFPMAVTLAEISALKTPQFQKAQEPTLVTPFSITTLRILSLFVLQGWSPILPKSGMAP